MGSIYPASCRYPLAHLRFGPRIAKWCVPSARSSKERHQATAAETSCHLASSVNALLELATLPKLLHSVPSFACNSVPSFACNWPNFLWAPTSSAISSQSDHPVASHCACLRNALMLTNTLRIFTFLAGPEVWVLAKSALIPKLCIGPHEARHRGSHHQAATYFRGKWRACFALPNCTVSSFRFTSSKAFLTALDWQSWSKLCIFLYFCWALHEQHWLVDAGG